MGYWFFVSFGSCFKGGKSEISLEAYWLVFWFGLLEVK